MLARNESLFKWALYAGLTILLMMVQGSLRVQPAAAMMGQASGVAAVQHCRTGQPARDLDTEELVRSLRAQGANLPQETLSKTMTRGGTPQSQACSHI